MIEHKFKKKYGQNFLMDNNILNKIYLSIKPDEEDLIIEIGPGSGNLTKYLKEYKSNLICFEIDESLKDKLSKYEDDKTKIIFEDFMNASLDYYLEDIKYKDIYVIANIPYYITTPIIEKLTFSNLGIKSMVLMVQKEVADRLASKPGTKDYGYITAFLNCFYKISKLFNVSRGCFYPIPNVDSAIIKLDSINRDIKDVDKLNRLLKDAFKFKRKNLRNNLKDYDLIKIEELLKQYGFSLSDRAEDIPVEVYIQLVDVI